jgi:hypothetical protein
MSDRTSLKSILLLAANPKGTKNLRLQEEEREIKEQLRIAGYGKVPINSSGATRPRDIQQAMLDFKPQVVHFSGHGAGKEGLVFEDGTGQEKLVDSEALANLFRLFTRQYPIECVVLNACYSKVQAQAIARHVDYVIGMSQAIGDRAAIEFSVGFYKALGAGESFQFAYELGCLAIQLEGISEYLTPIIWEKGKLLDISQNNLTQKPQVLNPIGKDVAPIQEQITADKEAEYQQQQEEQRRQQEQAKAQYENKLLRYEQEFLKAVRGEYPLSEYVRDGLKRFQQSLGLKDEDVERIEQPIFAQKEVEYQQRQQDEAYRQRQQQQSTLTTPSKPTSETDDLSSERGVDYTKLRDLLASGQWREADKETVAVMLKAANREQKGYLDSESIAKFPCTDLRTIDQLWVKYSKGRFGFSVQKRIWESIGGKPSEYSDEIYCKFAVCVGWLKLENKSLGLKKEEKWISREDCTYDLHAPQGHLPYVPFVPRWINNSCWFVLDRASLFSRAETCKL